MKYVTGPLPEFSWASHRSARGKTSIVMNILSAAGKRLQWCQPEVITGVPGKVIKMA